MIFIGVDAGSTGTKALAFGTDGRVLGSAYRAYSLRTPPAGWRELDAGEVLAAAKECIAKCAAACAAACAGRKTEISAIAVSAQGEALVPLDGGGRVLAHAQVSFDTRCTKESEWIASNLDLKHIAGVTGLPLHTMWSLPKLLWIKNNDRQIYEKTAFFLDFGGFIAHALGAKPAMDYSLASRTMLFDAAKSRWDGEICSAAEIDISKLPAPVPCGTEIGRVSAAAAAELGLPDGVLIGAGGHDQVCGALGAGIESAGQAMNSMGTTDSIVCLCEDFSGSGELAAKNIPLGAYAAKGFAAHSFVLSTGSTIEWFKNMFGGSSYAELDGEAAALEAQPSGIFLLPHFAGSGTPALDPFSRGIFAGIKLETKRAALYKAVLEGINFELGENIKNMNAAGKSINELFCIGGAAKSDFYLQLKADILGLPVTRLLVEEASCLGAALLAARALGGSQIEKQLREAHLKHGASFKPRNEITKLYAAEREKYQSLYELSKKLNFSGYT